MTTLLSPHAQVLLREIINTIADELSLEDGLRWHGKIEEAVLKLADFPELGNIVPSECFATIPENADRLRQTFSRPYRIVYEIAADEVHILSIRHSRMLVTDTDTFWN